MIEILLLFIRATCEGLWNLHLAVQHDMLPWYFAYDRVNYARYLPAYMAEMENLHITHPFVHESCESGNFVAQRQTYQAFSQVAHDQLIEQSMNRDSKTKGGMIGFTLRKGAVNRWVLAHHERAGISHTSKNLAGKDETYRTRSEIDNARMMKDESVISALIDTFSAMTNPFMYEGSELINIVSGVVASVDTRSDIAEAFTIGRNAAIKFCENQLKTSDVDYHAPLNFSFLFS